MLGLGLGLGLELGLGKRFVIGSIFTAFKKLHGRVFIMSDSVQAVFSGSSGIYCQRRK